MKKIAKRIIVDVLGWFFIVLGVIGLFLPIIQGVICLIIGFYLLSIHSEWFNRQIVKLHNYHPKAGGIIKYIEKLTDKVLSKLGLKDIT
jgi:uncharacterized membrane protein YbaN (DUF454 family)